MRIFEDVGVRVSALRFEGVEGLRLQRPNCLMTIPQL